MHNAEMKSKHLIACLIVYLKLDTNPKFVYF